MAVVAGAAVAGAVIEAGKLTTGVLTEILSALGNVERKIVIGVANDIEGKWLFGEGKWTAIGAYYESGTSDTILPYEVPNKKAALYDARKTSGPVATGAVGVLGYKMEDGNTLGVMFSVPFDYDFYSNWWNAKVYEGTKPVDKSMYDDLYSSATFKGDDHWHESGIGCGYKVRGYMASSGTCSLQCYISKE